MGTFSCQYPPYYLNGREKNNNCPLLCIFGDQAIKIRTSSKRAALRRITTRAPCLAYARSRVPYWYRNQSELCKTAAISATCTSIHFTRAEGEQVFRHGSPTGLYARLPSMSVRCSTATREAVAPTLCLSKKLRTVTPQKGRIIRE